MTMAVETLSLRYIGDHFLWLEIIPTKVMSISYIRTIKYVLIPLSQASMRHCIRQSPLKEQNNRIHTRMTQKTIYWVGLRNRGCITQQ